MSIKNTHTGFTLIELVIYLALATVLLFSIETLYLALKSAGQKQQAIAEVEQESDEALLKMTQTVRNAQRISLPATSSAATLLSVVTYVASTSPTIFGIDSAGALWMKEGTNASSSITGPQVVLYNLSFLNASSASSSGSIKISFTAAAASTTKQFDSIYSKTFYGSATVRRLQQ